jgi:hypothetical protein
MWGGSYQRVFLAAALHSNLKQAQKDAKDEPAMKEANRPACLPGFINVI